jgi:tetratricopeptide (TPR) repeat protein
MNCERYQTELEDFLYGELSESRAAELRVHLAACPACAQAREALAREQEIFAQYYEQTALEPAPELWEAVRTRIQTKPRVAEAATATKTGWLSGLFAGLLSPALLRQAAFAAALIVVSVAVTTFYFKNRERDSKDVAIVKLPTTTPTINPPAPSPAPSVEATPHNKLVRNAPRVQPKPQPEASETQLIQTHIARAEREYQSAIKLLDRVIARNRDKFAPGVLNQYESSLALIDKSIAESRRALRERPGDAASGQFLLAAYAKKLELMQEIAEQAGQ